MAWGGIHPFIVYHHNNYMYLKWTTTCHKCEAPLDPKLMTRGIENKHFIREYRKIRPIFLDNNMTMYSFVGLELKRVCYACFINKIKIQPKLLRLREIGQITHIAPRSKSKTQTEIIQWFEGLLRRARVNGLRT